MKENFDDMLKKVNCEYEIGIGIELEHYCSNYSTNDCFFEYSYDEANNCYLIDISIKDFCLPTIRDIFYPFLHFFSYENAFYYCNAIEEKPQKLIYFVLSFTDNCKGFYFKLSFSENHMVS